MSKVFIAGDTHGSHDWGKLFFDNAWYGGDLSIDDYVVIAGDWGGVWDGSVHDNFVQTRYLSAPWTTLFVDGNHENHELLNAYPVERWNGGKIHRIAPNIIHLMRGQVYTIAGKTFFTMGGADSVDKDWRIPYISWWPEELPSKAEYDEALSNLKRVGFRVDYVVTHCCGTQLLPSLYNSMHNYTDPLTDFLWALEKDFGLQFRHWYFGHHHLDVDLGEKYSCLYQDVVRII